MIITGDCLEVMAGMEASSVDLIVTDPPYFKVKGEPWDHQWDTPCEFLRWLDRVVEQWARLLRPNGSLYCFASPQMAARVECLIAERMNVLNHIVWAKNHTVGGSIARRVSVDSLRSWMPEQERIIFAEHYGADNMAKGEAGYVAKCDELRGFVFEPLRAYLAGERDRAGFTTRQVAEAFQKKTRSRTVTGMAGHWFEAVQWALPTHANYQWLRDLLNANGGDYLRREYEELRREYEDLRRPFSVSPDVPYTDVWTFEPVRAYKGKHPCEKPRDMLRHIIEASSRPGAAVLDSFAGTGSTGIACGEDRKFIGIELSEKYAETARARVSHARGPLFGAESDGE
jgi:adenine-specific DNA-methyltransferase